MGFWSLAWLALCLVLFVPAPVPAQETRQDELARMRQEKAAALRPATPNKVEAVLFAIEDDMVIERILNPTRNFYPRIGGMGEGAGVGGGLGYRFLTEDVDFRVSAGYSFKKYWDVEARALLPHLANDWLVAEIRVRRRDAPQEDFFGIGPTSVEDNRSNYGLIETLVSGALALQPISRFLIGGRVEFLNPDIGPGEDSRFPSAEEVFPVEEMPGFEEQPNFIHTQAFITYDYGDPPLNPKFGGRYRLGFSRYDDQDLRTYSFSRFDIDVQQWIPFLLRSHVIALRGALSISDADEGHVVPFYLERTLGGAYSLRGYRTFRFRDRHLMLMQAEYRWDINAIMSGALFYDAGKVAPSSSHLNFKDLATDYGIGFRVGTRNGVSLRFDVALGSGEGSRYLLRFDNVF
jgi:outer membrane protein assembly factor BamA